MAFIFLTLILLSSSGTVIPARPDTGRTDSLKQKNARFMLLPILFSSPDTRLAVGILPQIVFRTPGSDNPSSIRMDAYYTQEKQYHLLLRPGLWLSNRSVNLSGKFSFKKWPTNFYGIGNVNSLENPEKFTEILYEASIEGTSHIGSDYYGGFSFAYRRAKVDPFNESGILSSNRVLGSGRSQLSSAGLVLKKDTRDNHFYPSKGSYHTLAITSANKVLGSDFTFTRYTLDLRRYLSLGKTHVLAMQGFLSLSSGDPPFRMLSSVGSTLRGYSTVRYIDDHVAAIQLEYRAAPLLGRIGFAAFAGMGDVFGNLDELQLKRLKLSAGIGIRYLFSRNEKINIRVDYAIGKDSSGDYIDLNEAF